MFLRHSDFATEIYQMLTTSLRNQEICTFCEFESTIEQLEQGFLTKLNLFNQDKKVVLKSLAENLKRISIDSITESLNRMSNRELALFIEKSRAHFDAKT